MAKKRKFRRPDPSPWCGVRDSGVHGKGLYATKKIPEGTRIIEYGGELIGKKEAERRGIARMEYAERTGDASVYIFTLSGKRDLDGGFPWNDARLINHSCEPNCETEIDEDDRVWVLALRKIRKGEELFYDYQFDAEHYEDHLCRCGSKNCFGYIVGRQYRKKVRKMIRKREKGRG